MRILFKATAFEQASNQVTDQDLQEEQQFEIIESEDYQLNLANKLTIKANSPFTEHFLQIQQLTLTTFSF